MWLFIAVGVFMIVGVAANTLPNDNKIVRATTIDSLDIAPVWSGHPVGFALLTHLPHQFAAFYDTSRQLTVAQRNLNERNWTLHRFPITTGWDSHNYIALAIDNDGYLHLSGDMHAVPLKYYRTRQPLDASTFERLDRMLGTQESRVTYPKFITGPQNEFIFNYRDGGSGNGNDIYNVYDLKTKTWKRLLDQPLTDGEGQRNAYFDGPIKGPDGYFHLAWVWRETPDASTNHDLSYARSKDLKQWETGANRKPLALPIKLKDCDIVDPVPVKGGIINGNNKIGFDDQGRVTVSYHKYDASNYTQPWTARLENGQWKKYQIANWPWHWNISNVGSLVFTMNIGRLTDEGDGRLTQSFRHTQFGSGTWLIDRHNLNAIGKSFRQSTPSELYKIEGTFPGLKVNQAQDLTVSNLSDIRYLLRWETLESNRDLPRPMPYPQSSMLRVYTVKTSIEYASVEPSIIG